MSFNDMCKWQYDASSDRLTVVLPNNTVVETMLSKQVLNGDGLTVTDFTLSDFDKVALFLDCLDPLQFPEEVTQRLAYSALACEHFLLPKQPQNWHFSIVDHPQPIEAPSLVQCFVQASQTPANLLVAHITENIADVILLEPQIMLARTALSFGEPFRISLNRLTPLEVKTEMSMDFVKQYA